MGEEEQKREVTRLGEKQQVRRMRACACARAERTRARARAHTPMFALPMWTYLPMSHLQAYLDKQRREMEQRHERHKFLMAERDAEKKNCVERAAACCHKPCPS